MIINSLVFSRLFYCSNVWSNTSKCNINKLQAVQNFACRIVSGVRKFDHVTPIRKELNWLSVPSQLYYRNATMAFKCMTDQAPEYLTSKFIKRAEVSRRSTRNSQLLQIPFFRTVSGQGYSLNSDYVQARIINSAPLNSKKKMKVTKIIG